VSQRIPWPVILGLIGFVAIMLGALTVIPQMLYPRLTESELRSVSSADARIELQQAQSQLQNNARTTLLQAVAGLLVVAGAVATWRQVQVNREGQITERFTRAIDQIGSEKVDVRIGGIYALERIAKNSPADRITIQFILGAFVRNHAPWHVGMPEGPEHPTPSVDERRWMQVRAPDVQAAVAVLARLPIPPGAPQLYLSRVDLRALHLDRGRAQLPGTHFRYANLARAWIPQARLDHSDLKGADLRQANLESTGLVEATLLGAYLTGANLRGADLRRADLRGADLREAVLDGANLAGAQADTTTTWPPEFDLARLRQAGVRIVDNA
jgi:hypothetical protein